MKRLVQKWIFFGTHEFCYSKHKANTEQIHSLHLQFSVPQNVIPGICDLKLEISWVMQPRIINKQQTKAQEQVHIWMDQKEA